MSTRCREVAAAGGGLADARDAVQDHLITAGLSCDVARGVPHFNTVSLHPRRCWCG